MILPLLFLLGVAPTPQINTCTVVVRYETEVFWSFADDEYKVINEPYAFARLHPAPFEVYTDDFYVPVRNTYERKPYTSLIPVGMEYCLEVDDWPDRR